MTDRAIERGAGRAWSVLRLAVRLTLGAVTVRRRHTGVQDRIDAFRRLSLPVERATAVRWDDRLVPFIEAERDRDAAVALGAVHGHLRLGQIETMRRIATGRLAEALGPVALPADRTLRTLDFPRAVPAILERLSPETRGWIDGYADGLTAVAVQGETPEELALLGIEAAPWTAADVLAVGRLAAMDFSWRVWHRLLPLRSREDWADVWRRLVDGEGGPVPHLAGGPGAAARSDPMLDRLWLSLGRTGSNAAAVAARRSATGGALLAADPHLGIMAPGNWLALGLRSPGHEVVGLTIPGVPAVAIGRNRHIAWGGTSLHAASSDLFDVSGEIAAGRASERRETIQVRWGKPRTVAIRETAHGPVVSDAPLLRTRGDLALTWIGHRASDEIGAMLGIMRSRSWAEAVDAVEDFAAPAQTFVLAEASGRVGRMMAAHLPRRPPGTPEDVVRPPERLGDWDRPVTARDLLRVHDPAEGYVASANDRPAGPTPVPVGFFFSPDERIRRLREVLGGTEAVGPATLEALHVDVAMPSAPAMRDLLVDLLRPAATRAVPRVAAPFQALEAWDGRHDADSKGALAFELLLNHLIHRLHGAHGLAIYRASLQPWDLLREDAAAMPEDRLRAAAAAALAAAARPFARYRTWGGMHRLRLAHPLGQLPVIGRRYRFADLPVGGSNETLMKTAHGLSDRRHAVRFGANARLIADLADPDATRFVLLGGQDGAFGSAALLDQVADWRAGGYRPLPLTPKAVEAAFPTLVQFEPPSGTRGGGSPLIRSTETERTTA